MDLKKIMAISGYPGLYRHISDGRNGIIVESMNDKKRMLAYTTMKISALEDIAVFTDEGELPLKEVLKKIYEKESGGLCPDAKSKPEDLRKYFAEVLPEYDKEKVYISDIKKILNWYRILHEQNILEFEEKEEEKKDSEENPEQKEEKTD